MKLNYQPWHLHNLANLAAVKLENLADNNATLSKLGNFSKTGGDQDWSIQFGADVPNLASFTLSNSASFSNSNFGEFCNEALEFKLSGNDSSVASSTLNISQNFLFGNEKVKSLKLGRTQAIPSSDSTAPTP